MTPTNRDADPAIASLRPVLLRGGAVLCDDRGDVRLGVRAEAFRFLGGDAPEFLRMAAAHLAALHAADAGLTRDATVPSSARKPVDETGVEQGNSAEDEPIVLAANGYLSGDLWWRALELRAGGCAVLPVVQIGAAIHVGPILEVEGRPCIECVRRAVGPNRQTESLLEPQVVDGARRRELVRVARASWRRERAAMRDSIVELDSRERTVARHHVRQFDDCPVCGHGALDRNQAPPRLRSVQKHPASDTGARAGDPEEVWARFEHLVSPLTGAVRHVRPVDIGGSDLIHVYTAGHAVRMDTDSVRGFMRDGRDASGGKGSSATQARASALCEALERFSWIFRGDEVDAWGTLRSVKGSLDPRRFLLFSESQYASREGWNEKITSSFQKVPERFDPDREIAWSRVWSLVSGAEAFVPTSLLYRGFAGPGATFCNADTNGLAAGLTLEEAILQGLLELVERDAVALWWYNRTRHPSVDTGRDSYVTRVLDYYESIGREAWILDLTSDLEVPVYAALSARTGPGRPEIIFGFGAHLDPAIALRRCVTEMNQMLAIVARPPEERDARLRGEFSDALAWWAGATLEEHPYLLPTPKAVGPHGALRSRPPEPDILADVRACLDILKRHGLDVFVRDMTRSDVGLPVVKVLVPALRSFWRRLAPGRLYDVPVRLRRLDGPVDEADVNPVSIFV